MSQGLEWRLLTDDEMEQVHLEGPYNESPDADDEMFELP